MKVVERFAAAGRAFVGKSADPTHEAEQLTLNQLIEALGLQNTDSDMLSEATYYACIKVLSESLGKLPLKVQQATQKQGIRIAREHKWYRCLNERSNKFMQASTFWALMEKWRQHYGNAYAWIDTRDVNHPQLWPIHPDQVTVYYDNGRKFIADVTDVYYVVTVKNKGQWVIPSEDVLHFKSQNTIDGIMGISVADQLRSTVQGNIKAQNLVNQMYENGMTAKAVLNYTGGLNDKNVEQLIKGLAKYSEAKVGKTKNIIPIPQGFSLQPLNIKLADNQFLEVKQYSALQIAAAFGVKPYQIGDYTKSSYSSAEAQQLSFLVDTLLFIVKQYEEEIGYKIFTDVEESTGYHSKFNTAVMLRADQQTQINTLSAAVSNFLMTPNEARERLDLPWMDGGDRLLGNGASIPVEYTGMQYTNTSREEEKAWLEKRLRELS